MRLSDQVREEAGRGKLLPTPEAKLADAGLDYARADRPGSGGDDLITAVARLTGDVPLLPTPTTQDGANNGGPSQFERNTPPLNTRVLMLPTPRATDGEKGGPNQRGSKGDLMMPSVAGLSDVEWAEYEPAIRRWEAVMGPAPAPTELTRKGTRRLSARFTEWMMGQPAGWITGPEIGLSRNESLKACGNGVVTQQAAAALADMLAAIGERA